MVRTTPLAPLTLAVALALSPAWAETPADKAERIADAIAQGAATSGIGRGGVPLSILRNRIELRFRADDLDGNGFSQSDLDLANQTTNAQTRSQVIAGWLARDLDWDGQITTEELRASLMRQARQPLRSAAGKVFPTDEQVEIALEQLIERADLPDPDGDGVTTFEEMQAAATAGSSRTAGRSMREPQRHADHRYGGVLDADGDGTTTLAEFEEALDIALPIFDLDGDGSLSMDEFLELRKRRSRENKRLAKQQQAARRAREMEAAARGCALPTTARGTRFVFATIGTGTALPTVSLGGDETITSLARLLVERGTQPLALLVSANSPVILDVEGAVERLQSITAIGAPIGVRGVAAGRVHLTDPDRCKLNRLAKRGNKDRVTLDLITKLAGRRPNDFVNADRVGQIAIPSGRDRLSVRFDSEIAFARGSEAGPLWDRFRFRMPSGLVSVDAGSVIARTTPKRYGVLPFEAGLALMVETGQLALVDPGSMDERLPRTQKGGVSFGGMTVIGGRGQDTLVIEDRVYRNDGSGGWRGGKIPTLRTRSAVTLPAGVDRTTATFLVPKNVREPRVVGGGGPRKLRILRED